MMQRRDKDGWPDDEGGWVTYEDAEAAIAAAEQRGYERAADTYAEAVRRTDLFTQGQRDMLARYVEWVNRRKTHDWRSCDDYDHDCYLCRAAVAVMEGQEMDAKPTDVLSDYAKGQRDMLARCIAAVVDLSHESCAECCEVDIVAALRALGKSHV
jgi:hypothetical protein